MFYRNINIGILLRVVFLGLMMSFFAYAINQDKWYMTSFVTLIISLIIFVELIYFLHSYQRTIARFLSSVKSRDFSTIYATKNFQKSEKYIEGVLEEIIKEFNHVRIEKEVHYQFLQTIIQHIKIAIICYDEDGKIIVINDAAKEVLGIRHLNDIHLVKKINPSLLTTILAVRHHQPGMVKHYVGDELQQLSVSGTTFKLQNQKYKLVSIQNIKAELDVRELESWKKLIRILNHEIMNSVTPISSLSTAVNRILTDNSGVPVDIDKIEKDDFDDIRQGIKTIEDRSKGLLHFVEDYKSLTKIPSPVISRVSVNELIAHIRILFNHELIKLKIELRISIKPELLIINADHEQIEQVMINLLLNAIDAVKETEQKIIQIMAFKEDYQVVIQVTDSGKGIDEDNLENIFVPFFTTKKGGSGIGLSLSRQIIHQHGGRISVQSSKNVGTTITIRV